MAITLPVTLPADLPEDWTPGQTVAPSGSSVGLTKQHGYNYLMEQVNNAPTGENYMAENTPNAYGCTVRTTTLHSFGWEFVSGVGYHMTISFPGSQSGVPISKRNVTILDVDLSGLSQSQIADVLTAWYNVSSIAEIGGEMLMFTCIAQQPAVDIPIIAATFGSVET